MKRRELLLGVAKRIAHVLKYDLLCGLNHAIGQHDVADVGQDEDFLVVIQKPRS